MRAMFGPTTVGQTTHIWVQILRQRSREATRRVRARRNEPDSFETGTLGRARDLEPQIGAPQPHAQTSRSANKRGHRRQVARLATSL